MVIDINLRGFDIFYTITDIYAHLQISVITELVSVSILHIFILRIVGNFAVAHWG